MIHTCGYIPAPHCDPRDYKKDVEETIEFARKELNLDLSFLQEEMLFAAQIGQFEFSYLGPGQFKGEAADAWNCELKLLGITKYFCAPTLYDSRTGENPLR